MPAHLADTQAEQDDLAELAAELSTRGLKTILVTGEDRLPYLDVLNPDAPALAQRIYAQGGSYWWPHADVIASRDQLIAAADIIARALGIPAPETSGD